MPLFNKVLHHIEDRGKRRRDRMQNRPRSVPAQGGKGAGEGGGGSERGSLTPRSSQSSHSQPSQPPQPSQATPPLIPNLSFPRNSIHLSSSRPLPPPPSETPTSDPGPAPGPNLGTDQSPSPAFPPSPPSPTTPHPVTPPTNDDAHPDQSTLSSDFAIGRQTTGLWERLLGRPIRMLGTKKSHGRRSRMNPRLEEDVWVGRIQSMDYGADQFHFDRPTSTHQRHKSASAYAGGGGGERINSFLSRTRHPKPALSQPEHTPAPLPDASSNNNNNNNRSSFTPIQIDTDSQFQLFPFQGCPQASIESRLANAGNGPSRRGSMAAPERAHTVEARRPRRPMSEIVGLSVNYESEKSSNIFDFSPSSDTSQTHVNDWSFSNGPDVERRSSQRQSIPMTQSQFFAKNDKIKEKLQARASVFSKGHLSAQPTYSLGIAGSGGHDSSSSSSSPADPNRKPTEEELQTLRRIPDHIPYRVFAIGFAEVVERISYIGMVAVFTNFLQQPNPGTPTGRPPDVHAPNAQPGALGLGQRVAGAILNFNLFFVYLTPILGAYAADTWFGRLNVIRASTWIALVGNLLVMSSALPSMLKKRDSSLGLFMIGIIILGVGNGCFKPNIAPLIAEQVDENLKIRLLPSGEKVVVDPTLTTSKVYHWFYLILTVGTLIGQVSMVYTERYMGFWMAFLIPTICFALAIPVLELTKRTYRTRKPQGSVLLTAMKVLFRGCKGRWHLNPVKTYRHMNDGTFWSSLKPSAVPLNDRPVWYRFDDAWIDELQRGFAACTVFLWYPLYWLTYGQLRGNLVSQAATLSLGGVPNDVVSNISHLCTIIFVPLLSSVIYPALRKIGINFSPIKRIAAGFFVSSLSALSAAVLQAAIYRTSPCGKHAAVCHGSSPISVWTQTPSLVFLAISEVFTVITATEFAFTKAPRNMRSLVPAFSLLMVAVGTLLGEAIVVLMQDPLLVWGYSVVCALAAASGVGFMWTFRDLDKRDDELNHLPSGSMGEMKDEEK